MHHSRYRIRDFRLHTINATNPPVHKECFHKVRAKLVSESTSTFVVVCLLFLLPEKQRFPLFARKRPLRTQTAT